MVAFPEEYPQTEHPTTTTGDSSSSSSDEDDYGSIVVLGKGTPENLKFEWVLSDWSQCSSTCGGAGFEMRAARCIVRLHNTTQGVDNNLCEDAGLETPITEKTCGMGTCPKWQASEWTPCDTSKCFNWHSAMQRRVVKCRIEPNVTLADSKCNEEEKPVSKQKCVSERCVGKWKVGAWSEVSVFRRFFFSKNNEKI